MIRRFLKYVEIMTKITSLFPYLMLLSYLFYARQPVSWELSALFFFSMLLIDLATTTINNYVDTKTNEQVLQFKRKSALAITALLIIGAVALGLWLVILTDIVVLILGVFCFACGIFYTYGPVPISRLPLGELFSGIFQGLIGPFLFLYINMPQGTYLSLGINTHTIDLSLKIMPLIAVLLLTMAPICTIANIMLANNICDVEKDARVGRFTLAYYLKHKALYLFAGLYYLCYTANIIMVAVKGLPPIFLLSLCTIIPVQRNIHKFFKAQDKKTTFLRSITNFLIIICGNTIFILLSAIIRQ